MESVIFIVLAVGAVATALLMVVHRNPVIGALSLVATLFCMAGLFVLLNAHFLAAIQVLVYAGAIMVLFLFVIMLLNLRADELATGRKRFLQGAGVLAAAVMGALLVGLFSDGRSLWPAGVEEDYGGTQEVGRVLFTTYLLPFEVLSLLLLAAIIGAVVLAKRRLD